MATFAEKFSYMDTIFSMSKEGKSEYCCNVIRIGQILPIPGKDLIGQTLVNGESIVIRKDQVKEGDVLLYAGNETQLSPAFLKANCLYSEPLCLHHRVPREGVCIRIRQDSYAECFKLKALAFLDKEAGEVDAGNVDMEMADGV